MISRRGLLRGLAAAVAVKALPKMRALPLLTDGSPMEDFLHTVERDKQAQLAQLLAKWPWLMLGVWPLSLPQSGKASVEMNANAHTMSLSNSDRKAKPMLAKQAQVP